MALYVLHSVKVLFQTFIVLQNSENWDIQSSGKMTAILSGISSLILPGQPETREKGGMTVSGGITVPSAI